MITAYIIIILLLIIMLTSAYIKYKFGFWVSQPVFHIYDLAYMMYPPGIINHGLPDKNKYTNFANIETLDFNKLSELKTTQLVNFIKTNYLRNRDNIYAPEKENVVPYFTSLTAPSFVSFYSEATLVQDLGRQGFLGRQGLKKGTIIEDKEIVGIMTSRPTHISIKTDDPSASSFDAYYVDYLCVKQGKRKKGIAPQLIQTHHYNQSYANKNISVSLFKREDDLTGIVPLCVYSTYGFSVDKWTKPPALNAAYVVLEVNAQNSHLLFDFIKLNRGVFDITVMPDVSNIVELIKTRNIFVNVVLLDDQIQCAYFFRKSCVSFDKGMEVLSCVASIKADGVADTTFIHGFKISFWTIADKNKFGFSAIEDVSHNRRIIDNLIKKTHPIVVSPTAYFFYNFAYRTFKSSNCFIVN
jgi:hypothetical protein